MKDVADILFRFHIQMNGYSKQINDISSKEYEKLRDEAYAEAEKQIIELLVQKLTAPGKGE